MVLHNPKWFDNIFQLACIIATVSMVLFCSYEFSKNNDLSEVSFKPFNYETVYPEVSLCLINPFLDDKFASYYLPHLSGHIWNETMVDVDFEKITRKLEDNILDTCVRSSFDEHCKDKASISTHVHLIGGKCLSFHHKYHKRVYEALVWMNNTIFPDGIRPSQFTFFILFTFPQQLLRMSKLWPPSGHWDTQNDSSIAYHMNFDLSDIQVIKRRNKYGSKCYDLENYDSIIEEEILSDVGCRPFYVPSLQKHVPCSTKQEMQAISDRVKSIMSKSEKFKSITPPCHEITRIQISYKEEIVQKKQSERGNDMMDEVAIIERPFGYTGWFRVALTFPTNMYMEIKQVRAYSPQSLIGNAGGYVGLLVGYSISQFPVLLILVYKFFMEGSLTNKNSVPSKSNNKRDSNPTKIDSVVIEPC